MTCLRFRRTSGTHPDSYKCSWEAYSKRGVVENLRLFAKQHEVPLMLVRPLSEKVGSIPGFCAVQDVCGRDKEMLLFCEDKLLEDLREKEGFDAYWKVKMELGEYVRGLLRSSP